MKRFPHGDKVFEVISRYDDLLTVEGRPGYEPGDTLALIVPFLLYHDISEASITGLAEEASLTPGARELVAELRSRRWGVFCISTSYEQYARRITQRVGIPAQNVACTLLPLDSYRAALCKGGLAVVRRVEQDILGMRPNSDDDRIRERLDRFFWTELPPTSVGVVAMGVKPRGGKRKVEALESFAQAHHQPVAHWVVVGDSITDFKMLKAVDGAGGLAIAFNANEFALPYSTLGLASIDLGDLWPVLEAWAGGRRGAVEGLVAERQRAGAEGDRGHFHWLAGVADIAQPLQVHRRIRRLVREEAAKLG
jgi:energy-converting hydrogenase A subunit R